MDILDSIAYITEHGQAIARDIMANDSRAVLVAARYFAWRDTKEAIELSAFTVAVVDYDKAKRNEGD